MRPDDSVSLSSVTGLSRDATVVVAPVIVVRSGETGTITCGTEYRFATSVDVRSVTTTNKGEVLRGTCIVPSDFRIRNVGTTLTVCPTFDPASRMIDIDLHAEVASEPTWREYAATYQRSDGVAQTVSIPQPSFPVRQLSQHTSVPSGATVLGGGLAQDSRRAGARRGSGWLGRLFARGQKEDESRSLVITVRAQIVDDILERQTQGEKP